jgi:hypothetical protein
MRDEGGGDGTGKILLGFFLIMTLGLPLLGFLFEFFEDLNKGNPNRKQQLPAQQTIQPIYVLCRDHCKVELEKRQGWFDSDKKKNANQYSYIKCLNQCKDESLHHSF